MNLAAIILAAGASTRMGTPKALLEYRGETFLDRLTGLFLPVCRPVIVVLGHEPAAIRAGARRAAEVIFVENAAWTGGQFSSLQTGFRAVPEDAAGVLFTPVDHPAVEAATIARLVETCRKLGAPWIVVPRTEGRHGHPVACSRDLVGEFLVLPAAAQARDVIRAHRQHAVYVDVDDPGILRDVDDAAAYRALVQDSERP